jgi:DNA-binding MarR family transcriptional regulator
MATANVAATRAAHLESVYNFANLVAASARSSRTRERVARAAGTPVTGAGLVALRLVEHHGPLAMSDLAARLEVDLSTASRQAKALEDHALVARTTHEADRRSVRLAVTRKGRTLLERVRDVALNDFDVALREWSTRDRSTLASLLDRLRADLLAGRVDDTGWSIPTPERDRRSS